MKKNRKKTGPRAKSRRPATKPADKSRAQDILVARGVHKIYRAGEIEVPALRDINLTVESGVFATVVGPSGSGKTTLLQCLSGLDSLDAGAVTVAGEDVHGLSETRRSAQRARLMGFIFQSLNLLPVFSALENVELPLMIGGVPAAKARKRAEETLDRVGLSRRHGHRPAELSGGEQQRVAVARAVVTSPAIVWADEPTGSLDTTTAREVLDLLEDLHAEGMTLILVTHDPEISARAGRRIVMRDGTVVEDTLQ